MLWWNRDGSYSSMSLPISLIIPYVSMEASTPWFIYVINYQGGCCLVPAECLISQQTQEWSKTEKKGVGGVPLSRTIKRTSYLFPKLERAHSLTSHCGTNTCLTLGVK